MYITWTEYNLLHPHIVWGLDNSQSHVNMLHSRSHEVQFLVKYLTVVCPSLCHSNSTSFCDHGLSIYAVLLRIFRDVSHSWSFIEDLTPRLKCIWVPRMAEKACLGKKSVRLSLTRAVFCLKWWWSLVTFSPFIRVIDQQFDRNDNNKAVFDVGSVWLRSQSTASRGRKKN